MNKNVLKSVGAILAGLITIFILAIVTDMLLENAGIMKFGAFNQCPLWVNLLVLFLRIIYNIAGCYLAARLAPNRPVRHALVIGFIGIFVNLSGAVMLWNNSPHWLGIMLVIVPVPCAWVGGILRK